MGAPGIGGLFIRSPDPDALTAWYGAHLGMGAALAADGAGEPGPWSWQANGGPVVSAPFAAGSADLPPHRAFMPDRRVAAPDVLIAARREAGVAVETRAEWDTPATGRFARIRDPDGNPVEPWETPETVRSPIRA